MAPRDFNCDKPMVETATVSDASYTTAVSDISSGARAVPGSAILATETPNAGPNIARLADTESRKNNVNTEGKSISYWFRTLGENEFVLGRDVHQDVTNTISQFSSSIDRCLENLNGLVDELELRIETLERSTAHRIGDVLLAAQRHVEIRQYQEQRISALEARVHCFICMLRDRDHCLSCMHMFCGQCIKEMWEKGETACPVCRKPIEWARKVFD